jgi:hypothetical protein
VASGCRSPVSQQLVLLRVEEGFLDPDTRLAAADEIGRSVASGLVARFPIGTALPGQHAPPDGRINID